MNRKRPIMLQSVDLDAWVHCRWASGSAGSLWPESRSALREVYGRDKPGEDFVEASHWILDLFDRFEVASTVFVLAEVAEWFPSLVREISDRGHEVALHGKHHVDNTYFDNQQFVDMLRESRAVLSDVVGQEIVGYRAPNLILEARHLDALETEGFLYDSSICPSRRFFGKFGNMIDAPQVPYRPTAGNPAKPGDMEIVELPLCVFPFIKLPVSTGIMTRVIGDWWTRYGLAASLRRGYALYYFHPWELLEPFRLDRDNFYRRLARRRMGSPFREFLSGYLAELRGQVDFIRADVLANNFLRRGASQNNRDRD